MVKNFLPETLTLTLPLAQAVSKPKLRHAFLMHTFVLCFAVLVMDPGRKGRSRVEIPFFFLTEYHLNELQIKEKIVIFE